MNAKEILNKTLKGKFINNGWIPVSEKTVLEAMEKYNSECLKEVRTMLKKERVRQIRLANKSSLKGGYDTADRRSGMGAGLWKANTIVEKYEKERKKTDNPSG